MDTIKTEIDMETEDKNGSFKTEKLDPYYSTLILFLLTIPFTLGLVISLFSLDESIRTTFKDSFNNETKIPDIIWGITNGFMPLGGLIGTLGATQVSVLLGRKLSTIICVLISLIGDACFFVSYFTQIFPLLVLSRFLHGMGAGSGMNVGLCYYFELLCPKYKVIGGSLVQLFINLGIVGSSVMSLKEISNTTWYLVGIPLVIFHLITIGAVFLLPESPYYVYEKTNNIKRTEQIFTTLRGNNYIGLHQEIDNAKRDIEQRKNVEKVSIIKFITNKSLTATTFFMAFLSSAQQLSGINVVIFYSTEFLKPINFYRLDLGSLIMFLVCLFGSIVFTFFFPNLNSKILLLIGFGGMSICFYMGYICWMVNTTPIIIIVCLALFLFMFQAGPGPKPWVIAMETYALKDQAAAQTVLTTFNWGFNTFITMCYQFIGSLISFHSVMMFALINTIFTICVAIFMVDPKDKSSDEIVVAYQKKFPCLKSS